MDLGTPSLTVVDNIDTEKTLFSMSTDFLAGLNLDPYWSYEYSLDNVNPTFKKLELYDTGWSYHLASGARYIGCGAEGYLWVSNEKGDIQGPENKYGIDVYKRQDAASGAYAQPVPSDIWRDQTLELTADGKETIADCNQYVKEWGNYCLVYTSRCV